jgi:hypothetical protein
MQVSPLSWAEWKIVLCLSFPVSNSALTCYIIRLCAKLCFSYSILQ